jgi:hypothetical protein
VVGGVSEQAKQAIESVDGVVIPMHNYLHRVVYGVCLLHHPDDDDQGFCWYSDDGAPARKLFIRSADEWHDLYIYCEDGSIPRFESDITQLRIVTEAEWFEIADKRASEAKQENMFQVGDCVLVTDEGQNIVNEPATIEDIDEISPETGKYWCVFDQGRKTERESYVGVSFEETRLDPGWFREDQLQVDDSAS